MPQLDFRRCLLPCLLLLTSFLLGPVPSRAAVTPTCLEGERCPVCGDGLCDPDENLWCPQDCESTFCGDWVCNGLEDCSSCPGDCGSCAPIVCSNGLCEAGETCSNCAADCGSCPANPVCGNTLCETGESCSSCAGDCGACPEPACGNLVCEEGESCSSCSEDCGTCGDGGGGGGTTCNPPQACGPTCQNFICEAGESCSSCAFDCGSCPFQPVCGDSVCDYSWENCNNCGSDCCPGGGDAGENCWGNLTCGDGNVCNETSHQCCKSGTLGCSPMNF